MLSYQAFCAKHEAKYRGLSNEQKRSRYDDYRASFLANSNGGGSGSSVPYAPQSVPSGNTAQRVRNDLALAASQTAPRMNPRSAVTRPQAQPRVAAMSGFNRMAENIAGSKYVEQLLDPMANHDGKQPSFVPYPSTSFQVKETFLVKTRSDGEFCFLIRDDIDRFRADTWTVRDSSLPMDAKTTAIQAAVTEANSSTANPLFGFNLTEQFPLAASGNYQSRWTSCAEAETLKTSFSSFRTVSLGLEINYVEAPVDASGTICATLWHPGVSLPVTGGGTDTPDWSGAINFEDILDLEQSQSFPAIGGCSLNWRPFGESITQLRPTYMMDPDRIGDLDSDLVYLTASSPTSDADKLLAFMSEDGDNNALRLRDGWDNVLDAGSPLLMVSGAGLVGDKEPLRVTVCWTVEAVADERTFSLVQSSHNVHVPGAVTKVASVLADTPASHAGTSKTDGGGMPPSVSHFREVATKVGDGVAQVSGAEGTGQKIAAGIKTAGEVASIIASFF